MVESSTDVIEFAPLPFGVALLSALVVIAFVSGIGITAIGPGGIFLTISLYALTPLSPSTIAGTAQLLFVATGILGSIAYVRSGEVAGENLTWTALLCAGSIGGALFGARINAYVSRELFGILLGFLACGTGLLIIYRERQPLTSVRPINHESLGGKLAYVGLGIVLGTFSGLLGVGGPVIAVPALVLVGVPMLPAVAAAQVQSIFIATFASVGYLTRGAVSPSVAVAVGLPLFVGVGLGWLVAQRVDPDRLKLALGGVLVAVTPYLAL